MGGLGNMYKAKAILKEMMTDTICPNEIAFTTLIMGSVKMRM